MRIPIATLMMTLCVACSGASSAGYDRLGIRITPLFDDGTPGESTHHCFTLPLLLGSRIEEEYPIADSVVLEVSANRDEVSFSSWGAQDDIEGSYELVELENGFSDDFELTTREGQDFLLAVQSGCFPTAESE